MGVATSQRTHYPPIYYDGGALFGMTEVQNIVTTYR